MKLFELKNILNHRPGAHLHFILPNGDSIPAHAHVSDVARIDKRFIDCGGVMRSESLCRLQTWFADDLEHRLTAGKLAKILDMAKSVLGSDDLEVDVEHQMEFISQFPIKSIEPLPNEVIFHLTERRTVCLAEDRCMPPKKTESAQFDALKFNPRESQKSSGCCGGK